MNKWPKKRQHEIPSLTICLTIIPVTTLPIYENTSHPPRPVRAFLRTAHLRRRTAKRCIGSVKFEKLKTLAITEKHMHSAVFTFVDADHLTQKPDA